MHWVPTQCGSYNHAAMQIIIMTAALLRRRLGTARVAPCTQALAASRTHPLLEAASDTASGLPLIHCRLRHPHEALLGLVGIRHQLARPLVALRNAIGKARNASDSSHSLVAG